MDIDFFMEHTDEFEKLSAEDQAKVFEGQSIEGEISSVPPDAAAQTASEPEGGEEAPGPGEAGEKTAVLAKDGKHLIPFEELQQAREQARYWQAMAEEASRQREAATTPQQAPGSVVDLKDLRRQLREASLLDDDQRVAELEEVIDAELLRKAEEAAYRRLEQKQEEISRLAEQQRVQTIAEKLIADHPYLDHNGAAPNWEAIAQVQALRDLYAANGTPMAQALADAVARVAQMYAEPAKSEPPAADIAAQAEAAIAKAKTTPPNSMSSIPSASVPHHDEAAALLEMSPMDVSQRFASMTPDQIEKTLARLL